MSFHSYFDYPGDVMPHWPVSTPVFSNYRPLGALSRDPHSDTGHRVITDREKFQICLDMHQFTPSEIIVKTVGDQIVVEGKHEDRVDDHGSVARHFVRKYPLPNHHHGEDVVSSLSSDGILTITAPRKKLEEEERLVPIVIMKSAYPGVVSQKNDEKTSQ